MMDEATTKRITAYVISFDGTAVERLKHSLDGTNMRVERVPAIDGRALNGSHSYALDARRSRKRLGRPLTPSEMGCVLSHRLAYERLLESEADIALVCEDDAELVVEARILLELQDALVQDSPTIMLLASRSQSFIDVKSGFTRVASCNAFHFKYVPLQAVAYFINRAAAEIALSKSVDGPADWPSWASAVSFRGAYPWPFRESGRASTVGDTPSETRWAKWASVSGARYLSAMDSYASLSEFLYRDWLPRLEARKWRRGRQRRLWGDDGPWVGEGLLEICSPAVSLMRRRSGDSVQSEAKWGRTSNDSRRSSSQ